MKTYRGYKTRIKLSELVDETLSDLSPIQKIMKITEERNIEKMGLKTDEVISFGGGWCNHYAPEPLRKIYQDLTLNREKFHKTGRYSAIIGDYRCREQLCVFEKKIFNVKNLKPENILLGHSSTQLFYELLKTLCDPGDNVCFLDPTYANYVNAVKSAVHGSKILFIPALDEPTWSYLPDKDHSLESLKSYCSMGNVKLLVLPVPDNPTSQIPDDDFISACVEIMRDYNGFVILDFAYKCLWFDEKPGCFSWDPVDKPNVIAVNSNSKWLSSLGRRFGWVVAHRDIISALEKINECMLLSPDTMHSSATASFLEETLRSGFLKDYIEEIRGLYKKTADVMIKAIDDHLGWQRLVPMGGLYTCCRLPVAEEPVSFVEKMFKTTGVLLIPGEGFGPSMKKAVRISYGPHCYTHDLIKQGIKRIGFYMKNNH